MKKQIAFLLLILFGAVSLMAQVEMSALSLKKARKATTLADLGYTAPDSYDIISFQLILVKGKEDLVMMTNKGQPLSTSTREVLSHLTAGSMIYIEEVKGRSKTNPVEFPETLPDKVILIK